MKKEVKKIEKMLGIAPKLPAKKELIEALCADMEDWDLELLLSSAQSWRASLLKKRPVAELREMYKDEICGGDLMNGGEEQ